MNTGHGRFGDRFPAIFMLVSTIALLAFGAPRFLAELALIPGTPIYKGMFEGLVTTDDELTILEDTRIDALKFADLPLPYRDLGASYVIRGLRSPTPEMRNSFLLKSVEATEQSLKLAPLNTFAWARLCSTNIRLGPDYYGKAIEAWRTSVTTTQFEPLIQFQRIHQGVILYADMPEADQALLEDQVAIAYRWDKHHFRQYLRQYKLSAQVHHIARHDAEMAEFLKH